MGRYTISLNLWVLIYYFCGNVAGIESSCDIQIGRNVNKMSPGSAVRVMIVLGGGYSMFRLKKEMWTLPIRV